jgi:hypothetical protein
VNFTTPPFTLESVDARVGPGFDNIVSLKAINYNNEGGGNWMGIDYVQLNPVMLSPFPWAVGRDDDGWPVGDGGEANATFVQENGVINALPGNPTSPETDGQADNDYYLAGNYTRTIPSVAAAYGDYTPVGLVPVNEEAAERAFAGADNDLRYHFNLPTSLQPDDLLAVTFDAVNLDDTSADPRYGVEVYFNGVLVQPEIVIRPGQLGVDYTTPQFTLASVNAGVGPGFDNVVSLKGINYSTEGGGNWMGIDYVQLNPVIPISFPWAVGQDDNTHIRAGDGGGPNTSFVQENGVINPLPGSPTSPEADGQADNDYYFAGSYTTTIPSVAAAYGPYTPAGLVPVNEEAAERAFAGADNDLRYHFNLPSSLHPDDLLAVTFDPLDLDGSVADPHYGVEVYFNGVLVQPQIVMRPAQLDVDYTTPPFTLASVNAQVGPGFDNIVSLKGINYNNEGGGNWMGIDYVQLNMATVTNSTPVCSEIAAATAEDTVVSFALTATDDDPVLSFVVVDPPSHGVVVVAGNVATYAPNADFCGTDVFAYKAVDPGGKASAPCTVTVTVDGVVDPPICIAASATVCEDKPTEIILPATDADLGSCLPETLTFAVVTQPANGTVSLAGNVATYQGNTDYSGPDSFTFEVTDMYALKSGVCTVSVTVEPGNDSPVGVIKVMPTVDLGPSVPGINVMSPNNIGACVILDATQSSDVDNDFSDLSFTWLVDGVVVGTGPVLPEVCLLVGESEVKLIVNDGTTGTGPCDKPAVSEAVQMVTVLTGSDAIEELIMQIYDSDIVRKNKQPFIASLKNAAAAFERGSFGAGINMLEALIHKFEAQLKQNPDLQAQWIKEVQSIIDGMSKPVTCDDGCTE